ncbi:exo-alpha-sialidase [Streptomyces sp. NPDC058486]|uniref:exo-alpha-sialidase n=1 Tax=unclassified Streptomyces TaxID=2593676 RepID=UPI003667CD9B
MPSPLSNPLGRRALRRPAAAALALASAVAPVALPASTAVAAGSQSVAAGAQSSVVSQDCNSGRIRVTLSNPTATATTFTVTWPGMGTWTPTVAAGDSTNLFFTKADGTAYSIRSTTPQGLDTTATGTLDCGKALSALVSMECPRDADGSAPATNRLKLALVNRSPGIKTFTVTWPGRSGSPWIRSVPAGASDDTMYWTLPVGTAYNLTTTAPGFSRTVSGKATCGLGAGTPGMNAQTLLSTSMPISGVNIKNPDGTYREGTSTAKSVRIPALAVTNADTVIAMADARISGTGDVGVDDVQIAMRRSTDGGATWSAPRVVAHPPTTAEGYGDPSLLVDRTSGKIFAFFAYSPARGVSFWSGPSGSNSATDSASLHIRYISSTDDGVTWSAPIDLNPQVKNVAWGGLFPSSGHGTQLASGRLVQPIVYRLNGVSHASNIYSDDHGVSWRTGTAAATGVNEHKTIQRGSGKVVQNIRHDDGGNRWYATASDAGGADVASSYGQAWNSGLVDPGCNADEISYLRPTDVDASGRPLLTGVALQSNVADASSRDDLTVRVSEDDGATWTDGVRVKSGPAGYSTMAVLKNGTIGTLYEIGATGGIVYSAFTLDWAKQN